MIDHDAIPTRTVASIRGRDAAEVLTRHGHTKRMWAAPTIQKSGAWMTHHRTFSVRRLAELPVVDRGSNVTTAVIVGPEQGAERFLSGVTTLPADQAIRVHMHNCDEQVTILSGHAQVRIEDQEYRLQAFDTTFIPAETWHAFRNAGTEPLIILWIYGATEVTRTFADTGETIQHLSSSDLAQRR